MKKRLAAALAAALVLTALTAGCGKKDEGADAGGSAKADGPGNL